VQEGDKTADADDGTQQQNKYCFNHLFFSLSLTSMAFANE
jgi:hypothetical protein